MRNDPIDLPLAPGTSSSWTSPRRAGWGAIALLVGCSVRPLENGDVGATSGGDTSGEASGAGSTGPTPATTGATVTTGSNPTTSAGATGEPPDPGTSTGPVVMGSSTGDGGDDLPCGFICEPDLPPNNEDCEGTKQLDPDCPEGHKCTLEGSLGNTQCVEIVPNPKGLYEPCTAMGDLWSGLDDCGLALFCFDVDQSGDGICIGMCDGQQECKCADPQATPTWCQECAVGLCLPPCDPLLQDCPGGDLCIPDPGSQTFVCILDASGDEGQVNDPCEFANACDKGLLCADTSTASSACDPQVSGCCQPFCQFPGGDCPNPDQACVQWFEPGQVDEEFEDIGICKIP